MTKTPFPRSRIRFIPAKHETEDSEQESSARPLYVDALDNIPLAIYKYFPSFEPDKILIFYHEAGLYQCQQYHEFASELSSKYNIGVYLVELRGHGFSGGRIDMMSSGETLLDDIEQVIRWVSFRHMKARLYLGAHSQTCALLSYFGTLRHIEPLSGFVMIAPYFGPFSTTSLLQAKRGLVKSPVTHAKWFPWFLHYISSGKWSKNVSIWQFNSSQLVGPRDPKRISRYHSEMARFMNVISAKDHLSKMAAPFFILLPSRDERYEMARLVNELEIASRKVPRSVVHKASDADFISVLHSAPGFISKQTTLQSAIS